LQEASHLDEVDLKLFLSLKTYVINLACIRAVPFDLSFAPQDVFGLETPFLHHWLVHFTAVVFAYCDSLCLVDLFESCQDEDETSKTDFVSHKGRD